MNINSNNYEEFFLLYVDGELETAQRAAVEEFVQQHPEYAEELEVLQQAVLLPEPVSFYNKEDLYRTETGITKANCEAYFLLAVDNELPKTEQDKVETFVLQNPEVQEAFTLLQQTKLPVENIPFPDKALLYRIEKERRIIPISWMKMSAAAAIIILIATTWITQSNNVGDNVNQVAVNVSPKPTTTPKAGVALTMPASPNNGSLAAVEKENKDMAAQNEKVDDAQKKKSIQPTTGNAASVASNRDKVKPVVPVEEKKIQKLLPPTEEMLAALIDKPSNNPSATPTDVSDRNSSMNENKIMASAKTNAKQPDALVKTAVYKEFEEDEESKSIYLGAAEINRNKLKSIFKKASTLFERKEKNNDDEDRTISIASFQFKSK